MKTSEEKQPLNRAIPMQLMLSLNEMATHERLDEQYHSGVIMNIERTSAPYGARVRNMSALSTQLSPRGRRSSAGTELRLSPRLTAAGVDDNQQVPKPSRRAENKNAALCPLRPVVARFWLQVRS